jgi:hypothetical protein
MEFPFTRPVYCTPPAVNAMSAPRILAFDIGFDPSVPVSI